MNRKPPVVGQEVWIVGGLRIGQPFQATVTKVGRKYFEVSGGHFTDKFYNDRWTSARETNYPYRAFPAIEEYNEEQEHNRLYQELSRAFKYHNQKKYSISQLRRIKAIIEEGGGK
jgi:hypothetical protein